MAVAHVECVEEAGRTYQLCLWDLLESIRVLKYFGRVYGRLHVVLDVVGGQGWRCEVVILPGDD